MFEGADNAFVERRVTDLALDFGLLTKHTSMVAIDVSPARPIEEALVTHDIPTNLPDGWDYESVFGITDHEPAPVSLLQTVSLDIPQGATPVELLLLSGLAIMAAGAGILIFRRTRRQLA